jgi:hypothetical protein
MTMIVIGHLFSHLRWFGIAGHTLSVIAYGTFGLSLGLSAIGTGESWANTGLFLSAALLHVNCSIYMADEIAGHKNGGGD